MKIHVVGATGATGRLLVGQLLGLGHSVRAIVRSPAGLPAEIAHHPDLAVHVAGIGDLSVAELARHVEGCDAVVSCLGHNLNLKGIYGQPRRLVLDATRRLCEAVRLNRPAAPVRFVLMNTTGNRNGDLDEPVSVAQRVVLGLLRLLVPPHVDNEQAADYLRVQVGQQDPVLEWVAVRPDNLVDEDAVTAHEVHPSPIRSAIFDAGRTSRINVAHFMAALATDDATWRRWRGQMPVIYNKAK